MESYKSVLEDGTIEYINEVGLYHHEDGPAIIFPDGREIFAINGRFYDENIYIRLYPNYKINKDRSEKLKKILK
jgi:hypothetical protein